MSYTTKTKLWPHQRAAVDFALRGTPARGCALWAYDMRTGKTLSAMALMAELQVQRVLVCAPRIPAKEWARQASLHFDGDYPPVCLLNEGDVRKRVDKMRVHWLAHNGRMIAVWNYDALTRAPELLKIQWDLIVMDECHRAKGPTSAVSKYLRDKLRQRAPMRLGLSGTPLPQGNIDAYGVYSAIHRDVFELDYWTHFSNRYAIKANPHIKHQITGWRNEDDLHARMKRWTVSCKMEDVLPDFIQPGHEWLWCNLDKATADAYAQLEANMIAQCERGDIVASNALVKALRLQQLAGGVAVVGEYEDATPHVISNEKHDALLGIMEDLPVTEPLVVFCQFVSELDRLRDVAAKLERPIFFIRGGMDEERAFHESAARGEGPIIGLQIQAGSEGIDLSESKTCFFLSTGYSSMRYRQARARLLGSNQKRRVTYWHIGAHGTIDESIAKALASKEDFETAILRRMSFENVHGISG